MDLQVFLMKKRGNCLKVWRIPAASYNPIKVGYRDVDNSLIKSPLSEKKPDAGLISPKRPKSEYNLKVAIS